MSSAVMLKRILGVLLLLLMPAQSFADANLAKSPGRTMAIQAVKAKPLVRTITADHSKFAQLQFTLEEQKKLKPEQVTAACLSCHNQAALQFHKTIHWTWRDANPDGTLRSLGKGGTSINNF